MIKKFSTWLLNDKTWIGLIILLMASLYCAVHFPYRGEEGQYTITSIEMYYHHFYWAPLSFGTFYPRPPLFNWLALFFAHWFGIQHILGIERVITISSVVLMGIVLGWFVNALFKDKRFALLCVLIFFTGDLLFRRSWIVGADPLFSFFTFSAMAFLWISCLRKLTSLYLLALLLVLAAFLTKALTVYVFLGVTGLVLLFREKDARHYFFRLPMIIPTLILFAATFLWLRLTPGANGGSMWYDISREFAQMSGLAYYLKPITFPLRIVVRFFPISLLALFWCWQKKQNPVTKLNPAYLTSILWIVFINLIPYWIAAPKSTHIRYLLPLYPFFSILMAYVIWKKGERAVKITLILIIFSLLAKIVSSFWGLPWFEKMTYRYPKLAKTIIKDTAGYPLYNNDTRADGLDIFSLIDLYRLPQPPIKNIPTPFKSGFVISYENNPATGKLYKRYATRYYRGKEHYFYLLCKGKACQKPQ